MAEYEAYKDSGTEWLGQIPVNWKTGVIGSLYTLRNTKVSDTEYPPLSVTMKGVVPQLENAAKTDAHDARKLVCKGDFAINSRSDRRGSCGVSDYDGSVSLINTVLTPRDSMNPQYYNWLFHTVQFADEFYKQGRGIVDDLWTTRWNEMKRILIPVPTADEQTAIAEYLAKKITRIDAIIAEAKASIEEYKAWKASIIYEAVTKGLDPNAEMKDSGVEWIGNIPQLFHVCKIKTLAKRINVGVVIRPSEYFDENGTVPFLRGLNIKEFRISDENMIFTNDEFNAQLSKSIIHTDDVLIVRDGSIGTACVVPPKYDGANVVSLIIVTPNDNTSSQYLCYCLNSLVCKRQFDLTKIGSALTHTSVSAVSNILITIPSLEMQNEIVSHLDSQCGRIDLLISEKEALVTDLEAYKKSLIFEVVTGKRKVV